MVFVIASIKVNDFFKLSFNSTKKIFSYNSLIVTLYFSYLFLTKLYLLLKYNYLIFHIIYYFFILIIISFKTKKYTIENNNNNN